MAHTQDLQKPTSRFYGVKTSMGLTSGIRRAAVRGTLGINYTKTDGQVKIMTHSSVKIMFFKGWLLKGWIG
jgi:hypothetical protein